MTKDNDTRGGNARQGANNRQLPRSGNANAQYTTNQFVSGNQGDGSQNNSFAFESAQNSRLNQSGTNRNGFITVDSAMKSGALSLNYDSGLGNKPSEYLSGLKGQQFDENSKLKRENEGLFAAADQSEKKYSSLSIKHNYALIENKKLKKIIDELTVVREVHEIMRVQENGERAYMNEVLSSMDIQFKEKIDYYYDCIDTKQLLIRNYREILKDLVKENQKIKLLNNAELTKKGIIFDIEAPALLDDEDRAGHSKTLHPYRRNIVRILIL